MTQGFELLEPQHAGIRVSHRKPCVQERFNMTHLLQLMGVESIERGVTDAYPVAMRQLHVGEALFHEGSSAEGIYFVSVGTFKSYTTAEDGYEQVLGFAGRGEVLGFDAINAGQHPTAAVALEDARVYVLPVRDVFSLGQRLPAIDRVLYHAVSRQLAQRGEIADVMAAVAAEVRLARFLVQMSARMGACGQSTRRLLLRMSRRDIASHLGVAHETVSRSFGALADWGYLRVSYREVEILDLDALKGFARSTRGLVEEPLGRARRRLPESPRANGTLRHAMAA
jgi:CRP/FNR family transcriptional regulator